MHMKESEWAAFAASKNLNSATGGKAAPPPSEPETFGPNDYDVVQIMREFKRIRDAIEQIRAIMLAIGVALAILHFVH